MKKIFKKGLTNTKICGIIYYREEVRKLKRFFEVVMEIVRFINENSDEIEKALIKLVSVLGWLSFVGLAFKGLIDVLIN